MTSAPKRVVVWGTGFVGKLVIAEIVPHPAFELVGVGVSNPDKVGRDAGEICGLDPIGIAATDDVDGARRPAARRARPLRAHRRATPTTTSGSSAPSCGPASTCARPR